ncbi:MAG TPA: hypothetical protein VE643_05460 [Nitrososphaeraceae archaeon]|nr:hypothetical protein [Nitrososphaeraceae archaeon]
MTNRQMALDRWAMSRLLDRLRKASVVAGKSGRPVVLLYRRTIEEMDQC